MSNQDAEQQAFIDVADLRAAEIEATRRYNTLKALRESVWEAINGIKFLGRNGG